MAVLTTIQRADLSRASFGSMPNINYTKSQFGTAAQAVEDWFEASRPSISTAIDTATAPLVLTAAQKVVLVKYWLVHKFGRGG